MLKEMVLSTARGSCGRSQAELSTGKLLPNLTPGHFQHEVQTISEPPLWTAAGLLQSSTVDFIQQYMEVVVV